MQLFNDQIIAELLEHDLETASIDASTGKWSPSVPFFSGSSEGKFIKWHTFNSLEVNMSYAIYTVDLFVYPVHINCS